MLRVLLMVQLRYARAGWRPAFSRTSISPGQDDAALLDPPVVTAAEDPPVVHEHGAHRDAALGQAPLRLFERRAQEFVHGPLTGRRCPSGA